MKYRLLINQFIKVFCIRVIFICDIIVLDLKYLNDILLPVHIYYLQYYKL